MRKWTANATDDGSIHSLGNGSLCAYGQGPHLIQVFGPPYSAPSLFQLLLSEQPGLETLSTRESGAAIWTHQTLLHGQPQGEMLDFIDSDLPVLFRRVRACHPFAFLLGCHPGAAILDNSSRFEGRAGGLLLTLPAGAYLYHDYPFPAPIAHQVLWTGPVQVQIGTGGARFSCAPGESLFIFCGGPQYPAALENACEALELPFQDCLERTRQSWHGFTSQRTDWAARLLPDQPARAALLQAIDDTAVLIKTQQSRPGAVLAGHNYHLAYVRDQYGVSRGLLALGHVSEARAIMDFYWQIWQRHGRIHNAQAAGVDGVFHVHENDEVEITGYLIQQAFDLAASGVEDAVPATLPMLEWAWEAQKKHLAAGMLPFNGDETYVAGGILPRSALNDGSAEATLLFIESGSKLLDWISRTRSWPDARLAENLRLLDQVRSAFRTNFWQGERLVTNNPARLAHIILPRFRHGVCERCASEGSPRGIEWTERSSNGRYLCPSCLALAEFPPAPRRVYILQSVALTPFFFGAGTLRPQELSPLVEEIIQRYRSTGLLPSREDEAKGLSVGYDYGLLLHALSVLRHPAREDLYHKTLNLVDPAGAWVEYYLQGRPQGTRCRPWESAINIAALLASSLS